MPARLTVFPADQPARQFPLNPERENLIGRGPDCDIRIADPRLSRRHALIAVSNDRWHFGDLGSKNGTTLAGRAPGENALHDGDWISFGGLLGRFADLSEAQATADETHARTRWEDTIRRSRRLEPKAQVDSVLQQMLSSSMDLAGAQRGFVMLADSSGQLQVRAHTGGIDPATAGREFPGSRAALARVQKSREPAVVCDTSADTLLGAQPSIVSGQIRALVCLPLLVGEQMTGLIYLDSNLPGKVFTDLDVEILEAFASHAALVIGVATVREELADVAQLLPRELSREPTPEPLLARLRALLPRVTVRAAPAAELP
ncbi:MAG: FHA domain-containing protein [Steroidobacteraceae bacterium]